MKSLTLHFKEINLSPDRHKDLTFTYPLSWRETEPKQRDKMLSIDSVNIEKVGTY